MRWPIYQQKLQCFLSDAINAFALVHTNAHFHVADVSIHDIISQFSSIGQTNGVTVRSPSVILEELCAKNHLPAHIFPDNATVIVCGVEYRDNDSNGKRNILLYTFCISVIIYIIILSFSMWSSLSSCISSCISTSTLACMSSFIPSSGHTSYALCFAL